MYEAGPRTQALFGMVLVCRGKALIIPLSCLDARRLGSVCKGRNSGDEMSFASVP